VSRQLSWQCVRWITAVLILAIGLVCIEQTPIAAKAKAAAKTKGVTKSKRSAPAPKPPPPPSYEQRLQWALQHMQSKAWHEAVQSLGNLDDAKAITPWLARAWFVRATLALKLQDPDVALTYLLKVWYTYPPLADYAAWEIAQYYAGRDYLPELQEMVTTLQERYPFSRFIPHSQLLLARLQQRFGELAQACATLERLRQAPGQLASVRSETLLLLSQLYEDAGEALTAMQLRHHLHEVPSPETRAPTILERKGYAPFKDVVRKPLRLTPEQMLASLDRLADAQLWPELEARFEALSKIAAPESLVIQIWLKRAIIALRRQRLDEAVAVLRTLLDRYPQGQHLAEGHYMLASVYERQNKAGDSIFHYERVTEQEAASAWAAKALLALTRIQDNGNGVSKAKALAPAQFQDVPSHDPEALWEAGWSFYRQKNYEAAELLWGSFERRFPHSGLLPKILYWRARVAQHTEQIDLAIRLYQRIVDDYPTQYHSVQAQVQLQSLGMPIPEAPDPLLPSVPFQTFALPPESKKATRPLREHFHSTRIRELQLLQMFEPAAEEVRLLSTLLPSTSGAQYFIATLLAESQQPVEAFQLVSGFLDGMGPEEMRGLPPTFWTLLYPRVHWHEVVQQARTFKVDPYLVLSVMRQESVFNPAAISRAGARGLMQIMPATAEELVARLRLSEFTLEQLHEPTMSITLGTQYLASLLQRYQGNTVLALAAYNAGPGRASRWREQWPDLSMDEFIEHIPLEETRFYVKYVLRNLMVYERLYKS
jgi:soluble lytic murein transglycosylase